MNSLQQICVYCGCSDRIHERYFLSAIELGRVLANRGITLVFGGGGTGLMGAVSDSALRSGGRVVGVLPEMFNIPALIHDSLSELRVVPDMHTRKSMLIEMADGFIALPGGFGTFEELFEVLTWAQIGLHQRPIGLLNVEGYYDLIVQAIERAMVEGFIYNEHRTMFIVEENPERLLDRMQEYRPPEGLEKWVTREEDSG